MARQGIRILIGMIVLACLAGTASQPATRAETPQPKHRADTPQPAIRDALDDMGALAAAELADTDEITDAAMLSAVTIDPDFSSPTYGIARGDCNLDGLRDASDATAIVLELFDGDGANRVDASGGSFLGAPLGCDANRDRVVDAGDLSCAVSMIFDGPSACAEVSPTVRMLVVGTPEVAAHLEDFAEREVALTNRALANSELALRVELAAVHVAWDYPESLVAGDPNALVTSRNRLFSKYDGYMDEAHRLRQRYDADILVMVQKAGDPSILGVAILNADAESASFGILGHVSIPRLTFAHEAGHVFGASHQVGVANNPPFPYAHGFCTPGQWHTIMSTLGCANNRLPYFSSPDLLHPTQGLPMGTESAENVARLLRERAGSVSAFRLPRPPTALEPIGHWPLDDGAGAIARDLGPYGYHGGLVGGTWQVDTRFGTVVKQAGASPAVSVGDVLDPYSSDLTLSLWFRLDPSDLDGPYTYLVRKGTGFASGFAAVYYNGTDTLEVRANDGVSASEQANLIPRAAEHRPVAGVGDGDWHHLALAIDADLGTVRGWLDGSHAGWLPGEAFPGATENQLAGGLIDSGEALSFGYPLAASSPPLWLADVRIFHRALGDAEVALLHEPAPAILVGRPSGDTRETFAGAANLDLRLASAPTAPVTVTLASSNPDEGVPEPETVTFDAASWSTPRRLRIVGVDDSVPDGDASYTITLTTASSDTLYAALAPIAVTLTNLDDELPADPIDPVAHWEFDETSGAIASDSSGNGYHGSVTGGTWSDGALALVGGGSCVDFGDVLDPGPRSFTVAGWVKGSAATAGVFEIVSDGHLSTSSQGFSILFPSGNLALRAEVNSWNKAAQTRFSANIANGVWHNIAMVVDRTEHGIRGYLDGSNGGWIPGNSLDLGGATGDQLQPTDRIFAYEPFRIGCSASGASSWIGSVDDFRYYHRALPAAEVQGLYQAGR